MSAKLTTVASSSSPKRARKSPRPSSANADEAPAPALRGDNVSRVFRELRELIVWGQLPPGARIVERTVAEHLGASRTPVRSALHRLQQEGFVTYSANGGEQRLIVAPMTQSDGQELYLMVGHLEGLAAHTAALLPLARRRTLVASLRNVNRELAAALKELADISRIFDRDLEFHRILVESVVGPRMLAMHRAVKPQIERYARAYVGVALGELPDSVNEHNLIIRGILKGDPGAAQHAAEMNWHNAAGRLMRVIERHGERGSWNTIDVARPPKPSSSPPKRRRPSRSKRDTRRR